MGVADNEVMGSREDSFHYERLQDTKWINSSEFHTNIAKCRRRNIQLTIASSFLGNVVNSIIRWSIFDAYLSFLAKSLHYHRVNSMVGLAESITGLTCVLFALPVGMLVDSWSRTKALKVAAVVGLVATAISAYAFTYDALVPLYANLTLWGIYLVVSVAASEAIFADSIETGHRSKYFTYKGALDRLGMGLGPMVMVILFYFVGDEWTLRQLHIPLLLGCVLAPIPCLMLWRFANPHPEVPFLSSEDKTRLMVGDDMETQIEYHSMKTDNEGRLAHLSHGEQWIPYVVAFSDFIRKIGGGMTLKFFPLFFIEEYNFKPVHISLLYTFWPIGMMVFLFLLHKLCRIIGRAQASIIFQIMAILGFVGMYYIQNVWIIVIVFLLRGSFQCAVYPIDKAIIMDFVPSSKRGLWSAVESFTSMTWSGSAILGGLLADYENYRFTFLITAGIYAVATLIYTSLIWLVPKNERDLNKREGGNTELVHPKIKESTTLDSLPFTTVASTSCGSTDGLRTPATATLDTVGTFSSIWSEGGEEDDTTCVPPS